MALPRLRYSTVVINFPRGPVELQVSPHLPRNINAALTGIVETIRIPRMDVDVAAIFQLNENPSLRRQLENWWQWAQQGNEFDFAVDSNQAFFTTLSADEVAGQTVLSLTSTSGLIADKDYALIDGPNYQVVHVDSIGVGTVTVTPPLDYTFFAGARFRSLYFWFGQLRDPRQPSPFRNLSAQEFTDGTGIPPRFNFHLEFTESASA